MNNLNKISILACLIMLDFLVYSQDTFSDQVDRFRKSLYSTFFIGPTDKYVYTAVQESSYSISTGDSLENPRAVELYGTQFFAINNIRIRMKLKKDILPKHTLTKEGSYFLFVRNDEEYYKNIDTTSNGDLTQQFESYVDSSVRADIEKSAMDPGKYLFVYSITNSKGNKKYYLSSAKSTALLKVRISKKDLAFIKQRGVLRSELEMWGISTLFGQYCHENLVCYHLYGNSN